MTISQCKKTGLKENKWKICKKNMKNKDTSKRYCFDIDSRTYFIKAAIYNIKLVYADNSMQKHVINQCFSFK